MNPPFNPVVCSCAFSLRGWSIETKRLKSDRNYLVRFSNQKPNTIVVWIILVRIIRWFNNSASHFFISAKNSPTLFHFKVKFKSGERLWFWIPELKIISHISKFPIFYNLAFVKSTLEILHKNRNYTKIWNFQKQNQILLVFCGNSRKLSWMGWMKNNRHIWTGKRKWIRNRMATKRIPLMSVMIIGVFAFDKSSHFII